jgi:translocator protein
MNRAVIGLVVILVATFSAAGFGMIFTTPGIEGQYREIAKPVWTPPDWVFPITWTTLYGLMAVAAWTVWLNAGWRQAWGALSLYLLQLALNGAWPLLFFGLWWMGAAFYVCVALELAIAATMIAFARHSRLAAAMMGPYLLWVLFACALNYATWRMNL